MYESREVRQQLDRIERILWTILRKEYSMGLDMDRLNAAVANNTDIDVSVQTLVQNIADELRAAAGSQDAVNALADQLESNNTSLSAMVVANTPADPGTGNTGDTGGTTDTGGDTGGGVTPTGPGEPGGGPA